MDNRMRGLLLALVSSFFLAVPAAASAQDGPAGGEPGPAETEEPDTEAPPVATTKPAVNWTKVRKIRKQIRKARATTWHWQRVMGRSLTRGKPLGRNTTSIAKLRTIRADWRERVRKVRAKSRAVPNRSAWLCIKRHEGAWTDPNAPYWGGLQMDMTFQRTYGAYLLRKKGTADRWKPVEQMWTAEKARRSGRGFHPWPNTARYCGLL
jgi:hypothetical protein